MRGEPDSKRKSPGHYFCKRVVLTNTKKRAEKRAYERLSSSKKKRKQHHDRDSSLATPLNSNKKEVRQSPGEKRMKHGRRKRVIRGGTRRPGIRSLPEGGGTSITGEKNEGEKEEKKTHYQIG